MKRQLAFGLAAVLVLLLVGAGVFRSQELPEPPDLPEPAAVPEPPAPPEDFFSEGRARLGVVLKDVSPEKARELKLPAEAGALVTEVEENSPASKAGLAKNDVIVEFAGERVRSVSQLRRLVRETPAGRAVTLQVNRAGQTRSLSVKLEPAKDYFYFNFHAPEVHIPEIPEFNFHLAPGGASLGISGDELTGQLANYFGVKQGKGVLVREVMVGSAAEKAGLKAGDVIVQVEGKPVGSVSELRRVLASDSSEEKRKVNLTIVRDRREQTLAVELERTGFGPRRRLAEVEVFGIDPEELSRMKADLKAQVGQEQEAVQKLQRDLREQQQQLQGEWRRQVEEQRLRIQEQLQKGKQLRELVRDDQVI